MKAVQIEEWVIVTSRNWAESVAAKEIAAIVQFGVKAGRSEEWLTNRLAAKQRGLELALSTSKLSGDAAWLVAGKLEFVRKVRNQFNLF